MLTLKSPSKTVMSFLLLLMAAGAMAYPVNFLDQVYPSVDLIEDEDEKATEAAEREKAMSYKNRFAKDEEEY